MRDRAMRIDAYFSEQMYVSKGWREVSDTTRQLYVCKGRWPYLMTRTRMTVADASSALTTSAGIAVSVSISV